MGALTDLLQAVPLNAVLREKITAFEDENSALKTENAILKDELREAQGENKRLKKQIESLTHTFDLDEVAIKLLRLLGHPNHDHDERALTEYVSLHPTRVKYYLDQLDKEHYISYIKAFSGRPSVYVLTPKGREFLVKSNLV